MVPTMSRAEALAERLAATGLDGVPRDVAEVPALDLGVQDTGPDGARWALAQRGADVDLADPRLATVWTVRGAPHVYRRADLAGVAAATQPFSDADAGKRIYDAAKPLKAAGIGILEALDTIAGEMRAVTGEPTVKGEVSRRLAERLPAPYLRQCRPCRAVHLYEMPFRLAALRAALELRPGSSPPVLVPVAGLAPARRVPERLDVVRAVLRALGPATPAQVAAYLDARVDEVRVRWPTDAVEVEIDGEARWQLPGSQSGAGPAGPVVRLLGPFDPFLQLRDRELLVPDEQRRAELWPVLGRPGAVLVAAGGDVTVAGTWRPQLSGRRLRVRVQPWQRIAAAVTAAVAEQAERLAATRGARLTDVVTE
ncbi:DNA glycosylase AlkZ-like family protein [Nakamurella endophytica]|nr:crosslink repair DNA glycosylase YcaQ family protein [Nakamurella endophytica]